ncbi:MAG: MATE family efflux transporter [Eubacteriales bacterium]|nr:MATE family efflux transporter [Eubacteriales bacterium]
MKTESAQKNAANAITEGVIWKQLLLFFFPLLFGTFFQMLYNMVDAVIVGRFVGTEALSAIGGTTSVLINLFVGLFVGLASGATVVVAQSYGAGRSRDVEKAVHTSIVIGVLFGLLMMVFCLLFGPGMLRAMNTPESTYEEALLYLRIYAVGMAPNMVYNMAAGILRAAGDSRRPLYFLIASTLSNIVLDTLFVVGLSMGVSGAAVATILSQLLSAVLSCLTLMRAKESYRMDLRSLRLDVPCAGKILAIGIPAGLQSMTYSLSNLFVQTAVNGFGTVTVAAWAINDKVSSLFWMIISSFGIATTTFVGQNYGAGRYERVRGCVRQSLLITAVLTVFLSGFIVLTGRYLYSMFTPDAEVIALGEHMILFMAPVFITYICIEVLAGTLRGMGDAFYPTVISVVGVCLLRIGWILLAVPRMHHIDTVMFSYPLTWTVTSAFFVVYYLHYVKKNGIAGK